MGITSQENESYWLAQLCSTLEKLVFFYCDFFSLCVSLSKRVCGVAVAQKKNGK